MFNQLNDLKQKMEETKQRLDTITVEGSAADGAVTIQMTANRTVKNIIIQDDLLSPANKGELCDYLEVAFNKAMQQATNVSQTEIMAAGKGHLPDLLNLF